MASIGGYPLDVMRGIIPPLGEMVRFWKPEGHDSYSSKLMGKGDTEFILDGEKNDTKAAIDTLITNLNALRGTVPEVVDQHGDTYTNKIEVLRTVLIKKHAILTGGAPTRHLEVRFFCLKIAD